MEERVASMLTVGYKASEQISNAPVPFAPGIFTMPSLLGVAPMATMSATGVAEAEKRRVLTPGMIGAGSVLAHLKLSSTSVGAIGAVGINPKANLWAAPAGISMGPRGLRGRYKRNSPEYC
jgi:hypothetical protein